MLGGTSDTSQLCEHGFYYWVMFRDELIQYSDENPVVGRYLGPAIDAGLKITDKIMKSNGEVVHCSTYCGLKEDENTNQDQILLRKEFDNSIRDNLLPAISPYNFPEVNLEDMPLYDIYE